MKVLLTDLKKFENLNIDSLNNAIKTLNEKILTIPLYGEWRPSYNYEISLSEVSHVISDIEVIDNKIWGNINFLKNKNARIFFNLHKHFFNTKFRCRFIAKTVGSEMSIVKIITWDIDDT